MVSVSLTPGRFDGGVVFLRVRLAHDTLVPDSDGGSKLGRFSYQVEPVVLSFEGRVFG
jgi:hypothetical protein